MKNYTEYKTELLEGAACLLRINGHPTVNNEAQELRNAATTQDLRVHLNAKYNWNDTTADEIDWLALGNAITRTTKTQHTFIQKLINGSLPLLAFLKIQDNNEDDHCPTCKGPSEDFDHFLQCRDSKRFKHWETLLNELELFLSETNTHESLSQIILQEIRNLTINQPHEQHETNDDFDHIRATQETIGWKQLLFGRFSRKWAEAQDRHLESMRQQDETTKKALKNQSGHKWLVAIIRKIWQSLYKLWLSRNEDLHGQDPNNSKQLKKRLKQRIDSLYELKNNISATDRHIYPEKEIIQQGSNRTMQSWLNYAETFITNALQQEQTRIKIGHKDIRQYCAPTIKKPPARDCSTEKPP